jgi:TorA maturation chaperone TorD
MCSERGSSNTSRSAFKSRSATYRLLARLTLAEVDDGLARALSDVPVFGEALTASGGLDALQALRVEYTRTFLMNVHPYESVYLDESAMLNTARSSSVLQHYRRHGLDPSDAAAGSPDHLGLELEFMASLIDQEAAARAAGDIDAADALKDEQVHFLQEHLLQWGPILGRLLAETAQSPFYQALGETVEKFLLADHQGLH